MQELHRSGRTDLRLSLVGIGYGLVSGLVGAFFGLVSGGWAVAVIIWITGAGALLVGLVLLTSILRPFRVAMNDNGLTVRAEGHVFDGPWENVAAIGIDRSVPVGNPPRSQEILVLWVIDGVPMRHQATFPPNHAGPKGHVLTELGNLRETRPEIEEILRRYAKDRFRSLAPR
jgi:hypothetical protein